jgi:hypothetical protein
MATFFYVEFGQTREPPFHSSWQQQKKNQHEGERSSTGKRECRLVRFEHCWQQKEEMPGQSIESYELGRSEEKGSLSLLLAHRRLARALAREEKTSPSPSHS